MPRSLIVLSFDALATSPLAAYGCSWLETPGLCRLAASSLVFDRVVAASVSPHDCLSGFFRDRTSGQSVAAAASAAGMTTLLVTDSAEAAELGGEAFDQCVRIDSPSGQTDFALADEIEETRFARLLAAALAHRETLGEAPVLLWIHSATLATCWDAPLALRTADESAEEAEFGEEYGEEFSEYGDAEPDAFDTSDVDSAAEIEAARESTTPPNFCLDEDADPDLTLAWMAAYGGQVRAIDGLVEVLLDSLEEGPECDLVLASTSGFALGEHRWIGAAAGPPRSPRLHLPLMIRRNGSPPLRSPHLASSDRLAATLLEMVRGSEPQGGELSLLRDAAPEQWATPPDPLLPILSTVAAGAASAGDFGAGEGDEAIVLRTSPGWFYFRDADGQDHLYLKPDDRNDANDIADLKPEVIEQLYSGGGEQPASQDAAR
ncbi:alkaline phosphatase family protein [Candidatus Laterigemmans baculatus]|uniref:hypothetical protein n=1 Tax=Candidatus Laterigemmans baculatus TaxID=2770505 RepID=UPI0013DB008B|nr:hypothetical protein [Candidatus Laterigemmans baculatus]